MKTAVLLLLTGAACGTQAAPIAKTPNSVSEGTASQQPSDEATRHLTTDECKSLGQSITDACHGTNTRSAQFEGWCSDVMTGIDTGSWIADCEKHVRYMDAVCITSNTSIRSMMDCDAAVQR
jgi:hypothetical protein